MKSRGGQKHNCLSRAWEKRLKKADRARGRQHDQKVIKEARDE